MPVMTPLTQRRQVQQPCGFRTVIKHMRHREHDDAPGHWVGLAMRVEG